MRDKIGYVLACSLLGEVGFVTEAPLMSMPDLVQTK